MIEQRLELADQRRRDRRPPRHRIVSQAGAGVAKADQGW
jgi:hypothetical protein